MKESYREGLASHSDQAFYPSSLPKAQRGLGVSGAGAFVSFDSLAVDLFFSHGCAIDHFAVDQVSGSDG